MLIKIKKSLHNIVLFSSILYLYLHNKPDAYNMIDIFSAVMIYITLYFVMLIIGAYLINKRETEFLRKIMLSFSFVISVFLIFTIYSMILFSGMDISKIIDIVLGLFLIIVLFYANFSNKQIDLREEENLEIITNKNIIIWNILFYIFVVSVYLLFIYFLTLFIVFMITGGPGGV